MGSHGTHIGWFVTSEFLAFDILPEVKCVSRAEIISNSVSQYIKKFKSEPAFGLWAGNKEDELACQVRLREE